MKYTRLFNNHSEYTAYTASTAFISPNVSYCILEEDSHCTPPDFCDEGHTFEVIGTPSYPSTVAASATSFGLSFDYNDIYTTIGCEQTIETGSSAVTISIDENMTTSARTVIGEYGFYDIKIQYSLEQDGKPQVPYAERYLTLDVLSDGDILWVANASSATTKDISYSKDYGVTWQTITSTVSGTPISVNAGDKVYIKGSNTQYSSDKDNFNAFSGGTATYNAEGNVMSLIYGDNFSGQTTLSATWALANVFNYSNVVSAENLVMPATAMTAHCYRATFANCPLLTTPPELPATTLANSCYRFMFDKDHALTTSMDLPATTLAQECYYGMFHECSGFTTAPVLSATTLPTGAYKQMFEGCRSLNYIMCLATDISITSSTYLWVSGVASSGTFVKDANMEDWTVSTSGIPVNWVVQNYGVEPPQISCDGQSITLSCTDTGATIYYKLNNTGDFTAYTQPIAITADTIVSAYSVLNTFTSTTVTETCVYDNGIATPNISCDGLYVTINCETVEADLYYRLNETGSYSAYTEAVEITATTVVEAYAMLEGESGHTAKETCVYVGAVATPVISCDGTEVTITCDTAGATILYRLDQEGSYSAYTEAIVLTADTVVESYATYSGRMSTVAMENCIYTPVHDYSLDYLTFKVLTGGTIMWVAKGSNSTKEIEYSINDGAWTSITSTTAGVSITVVQNDVVRVKGSNTRYCEANKSNYSAFYEGTALYNAEGNIMSLIYGDNFTGQTTLTAAWALSNVFNHSNVVSAENLVMPATTLTNDCYRATFANSPYLTLPPELPALTLSTDCYYYMFDNCVSLTKAPELLAPTLATKCYMGMFHSDNGNYIDYIKCLATNPSTGATQNWVAGVAASGTFVKASGTTWSVGVNGIPTGWVAVDDGTITVDAPAIACDGESVTITCPTQGASIYYKLDDAVVFTQYTTAITITADTLVTAYAEKQGVTSITTSMNCEYLSNVPIEYSNRSLDTWTYNNVAVETPYSVNAIDGHSSSYLKGTFNFETNVTFRDQQPTYLWFQHADQSASIYVDNVLVGKHWGGYTSFFYDITTAATSGSHVVKVAIKNNEGNNLAPAAGDFNYNATLGKVKLFTSPYLPDMYYGYDGFHATSSFEYSDANNLVASAATINVKTSIPTGASVTCIIADSGGSTVYSATSASTGEEMTFSTPKITGSSLHLWNGTISPYLYTITLEISHNNEVYHRYQRGYGLRYYEYLINDTTKIGSAGSPFTGFLLNGSHYLLRGCCMHDDIVGKANALNDADYAQTFSIVQELNLNFLRLAHYPHPKEVYEWCDRLGIVVQTEGPCVNKMQSTMPTAYFDNLTTQYSEMVQQHFNHPSIIFWGLSNETTTDDKEFARVKIEGYVSTIKAIDQERWVGYVMSASWDDPLGYYNNPAGIDWVGCNLYVGWYSDQNSNNPSTKVNSRITKSIVNKSTPLAYSEYGCGGTQACHSLDPQTTTTKGTNQPRHDIEYHMWLHEGHIAAIKNFPQLLFTGQWQLFDIAVYNRQEGYVICADGETTGTSEDLKYLNNKGLVERDHVTKKDTFYLYKAWWNQTDKFVHICGKDFTNKTSRVIKCYTNDYTDSTTPFTLTYTRNGVDTTLPTAYATSDYIVEFQATDFQSGDVITVTTNGGRSDTFTFA